MRYIFLALLVLTLAGCIGEMGDGYDVERLYTGKKHKLNEVARIFSTNQVVARQIDDRRFRYTQWTDLPRMIYEVEPGRHRILVERLTVTQLPVNNIQSWEAKGTASAEFDYVFEAGRRYSFSVSELAGANHAVMRWEVRLVDYDSGAEVARPTRPFTGAPTGAAVR
jgi:hypothetical protein